MAPDAFSGVETVLNKALFAFISKVASPAPIGSFAVRGAAALFSWNVDAFLTPSVRLLPAGIVTGSGLCLFAAVPLSGASISYCEVSAVAGLAAALLPAAGAEGLFRPVIGAAAAS